MNRNSGNIKDLIKYRIKRSEETFQDAELLLNNNRLESCINRLYYSAFYSILAYSLIRKYKTSKHSGIRAFFNQSLIKTELISEQSGEIFNELYKFREKSDYVDFYILRKDEVFRLNEGTKRLLKELKKIIEKEI